MRSSAPPSHWPATTVPLQLVHSAVAAQVRVLDGRSLVGSEATAALEGFIAAERAALFDLRTAPLLRVAVLIESDDELVAHLHHLPRHHRGVEHQVVAGRAASRRIRRSAPAQRFPMPEPTGVRYADFVAGELESLGSAADFGLLAGNRRRSTPGSNCRPVGVHRSLPRTTAGSG